MEALNASLNIALRALVNRTLFIYKKEKEKKCIALLGTTHALSFTLHRKKCIAFSQSKYRI